MPGPVGRSRTASLSPVAGGMGAMIVDRAVGGLGNRCHSVKPSRKLPEYRTSRQETKIFNIIENRLVSPPAGCYSPAIQCVIDSGRPVRPANPLRIED